MEYLALHNGAPKVHWEDKKVVFMLLMITELLLELKTLIFQSVLYYINFTMVSLFQNMISPVSCRKICAPNHVQVQ